VGSLARSVCRLAAKKMAVALESAIANHSQRTTRDVQGIALLLKKEHPESSGAWRAKSELEAAFVREMNPEEKTAMRTTAAQRVFTSGGAHEEQRRHHARLRKTLKDSWSALFGRLMAAAYGEAGWSARGRAHQPARSQATAVNVEGGTQMGHTWKVSFGGTPGPGSLSPCSQVSASQRSTCRAGVGEGRCLPQQGFIKKRERARRVCSILDRAEEPASSLNEYIKSNLLPMAACKNRSLPGRSLLLWRRHDGDGCFVHHLGVRH
jgi:hypothetical protein